MDERREGERPHVGVALPHGELRRGILAGLRSANLRVAELAPSQELASRLHDLDLGLVVLRRRQLGSDWEAPCPSRSGPCVPAVAIMSRRDDPWTRASLMAAGAVRVLGVDEPVERIVEHLRAIVRRGHGYGAGGPERPRSTCEPRLADFLSRSDSMRRFLGTIRKVTATDSTLLITGETGVGKERLARAIHAESPRRGGPFVVVNCGALPEQLLESELFGHEQGAFTGAAGARKGRFEEAHAGTLLLDEIGELPTHLQVKLLTILQRGEVRRLGSERTRAVDVRLMAATHRNLRADVGAGRFREDLFYRLNVVPLHVPSLRQRAEDIPDLVGGLICFFRAEILGSVLKGISEAALRALIGYRWPGNVRELINVVERCMLLCEGPVLGVDDLPEELGPAPSPQGPQDGQGSEGPGLVARWRGLRLEEVRAEAVERAERSFLDAILRESHGHVGRTATRVGIGPRALFAKMRRYGLYKEDYR